MARQPRVVAELGRPETPEETAARKAENSRLYKARKTPSNLVWALLVSLGVVLIMVMFVPRAEPPEREDIDVAAVAAEVAAEYDVTPIVPVVPTDWGVNQAALSSSAERTASWNISYVPEEGFVRLSKTLPTAVVRRQDSPKCWDMNGSIYVWRREPFLSDPRVLYPDTRLHEMPEDRSIDIDSELDFKFVEFLMGERERP